MCYFKDVKKGDNVYGLVFGPGIVSAVFDDGHYKMMVRFINNDHEVPYTEDGVPGWGRFKTQTLFYKDDIDLSDYDFSATTKLLNAKKIIKLREKKKLQVRLPSGIWTNVKKNVKDYMEDMLEQQMYHLFRKRPSDED